VKTGILKNRVHDSRLDSGMRRNDEMTNLLSDLFVIGSLSPPVDIGGT